MGRPEASTCGRSMTVLPSGTLGASPDGSSSPPIPRSMAAAASWWSSWLAAGAATLDTVSASAGTGFLTGTGARGRAGAEPVPGLVLGSV